MSRRKGSGPLGGHEQEILDRLARGEKLAVDLAREFGVSEAAISKLRKNHDPGLLHLTFQIGRGVECRVLFKHRSPLTRTHLSTLILQLEEEARFLLGEEAREEEEEEEGLAQPQAEHLV